MRVKDRDGLGGGGSAPPPEAPSLDPTDEGPMRGELRRQIALLERDIARFVAVNCPHEPLPGSRTRGPGILTTAELEEVRDELLALRARLHERAVSEAAARSAARERALQPRPRWWRRRTVTTPGERS